MSDLIERLRKTSAFGDSALQHEAADLLEANAAEIGELQIKVTQLTGLSHGYLDEIARLRNLNDEYLESLDEAKYDEPALRVKLSCQRDEIADLKAENEKLRAVYEAVDAAIKDEHEQGHDLDDLTPLWADVEQALAAVEQSEAGHRHAWTKPEGMVHWECECGETLPGECQYCSHDMNSPCCGAMHSGTGGWVCTRLPNHDGPHIACGSEHDIIRWTDTQPKGSPDAWIPRR